MDIQLRIWTPYTGDPTTQPPPLSREESAKYGLENIFILGFFFAFVFYLIAWKLLDCLFLLGSKLGWVKKDTVATAFNWIWSQGNPELQKNKKQTYQKNLLVTTISCPFPEHISSNKSLLKGSKVEELPLLWTPKTGGTMEALPFYHTLQRGPSPSHLCLKIRHVVFHLICCTFALASTIAFIYGCIYMDVNCRGMMTALTLPHNSCMND